MATCKRMAEDNECKDAEKVWSYLKLIEAWQKVQDNLNDLHDEDWLSNMHWNHERPNHTHQTSFLMHIGKIGKISSGWNATVRTAEKNIWLKIVTSSYTNKVVTAFKDQSNYFSLTLASWRDFGVPNQ